MTDPVVPKAETASAPVAVDAPIGLTEFCLRHSKVERSIELLNAFFAIESHAGRTSATEAQFVKRMAVFALQPAV